MYSIRLGDFVIIVNLVSCKRKAVRGASRIAEAHLIFQPIHSIDLNSIERSFAKLKHWLRMSANYCTQATIAPIGGVLGRIQSRACANCFAKAGYAST